MPPSTRQPKLLLVASPPALQALLLKRLSPHFFMHHEVSSTGLRDFGSNLLSCLGSDLAPFSEKELQSLVADILLRCVPRLAEISQNIYHVDIFDIMQGTEVLQLSIPLRYESRLRHVNVQISAWQGASTKEVLPTSLIDEAILARGALWNATSGSRVQAPPLTARRAIPVRASATLGTPPQASDVITKAVDTRHGRLVFLTSDELLLVDNHTLMLLDRVNIQYLLDDLPDSFYREGISREAGAALALAIGEDGSILVVTRNNLVVASVSATAELWGAGTANLPEEMKSLIAQTRANVSLLWSDSQLLLSCAPAPPVEDMQRWTPQFPSLLPAPLLLRWAVTQIPHAIETSAPILTNSLSTWSTSAFSSSRCSRPNIGSRNSRGCSEPDVHHVPRTYKLEVTSIEEVVDYYGEKSYFHARSLSLTRSGLKAYTTRPLTQGFIFTKGSSQVADSLSNGQQFFVAEELLGHRFSTSRYKQANLYPTSSDGVLHSFDFGVDVKVEQAVITEILSSNASAEATSLIGETVYEEFLQYPTPLSETSWRVSLHLREGMVFHEDHLYQASIIHPASLRGTLVSVHGKVLQGQPLLLEYTTKHVGTAQLDAHSAASLNTIPTGINFWPVAAPSGVYASRPVLCQLKRLHAYPLADSLVVPQILAEEMKESGLALPKNVPGYFFEASKTSISLASTGAEFDLLCDTGIAWTLSVPGAKIEDLSPYISQPLQFSSATEALDFAWLLELNNCSGSEPQRAALLTGRAVSQQGPYPSWQSSQHLARIFKLPASGTLPSAIYKVEAVSGTNVLSSDGCITQVHWDSHCYDEELHQAALPAESAKCLTLPAYQWIDQAVAIRGSSEVIASLTDGSWHLFDMESAAALDSLSAMSYEESLTFHAFDHGFYAQDALKVYVVARNDSSKISRVTLVLPEVCASADDVDPCPAPAPLVVHVSSDVIWVFDVLSATLVPHTITLSRADDIIAIGAKSLTFMATSSRAEVMTSPPSDAIEFFLPVLFRDSGKEKQSDSVYVVTSREGFSTCFFQSSGKTSLGRPAISFSALREGLFVFLVTGDAPSCTLHLETGWATPSQHPAPDLESWLLDAHTKLPKHIDAMLAAAPVSAVQLNIDADASLLPDVPALAPPHSIWPTHLVTRQSLSLPDNYPGVVLIFREVWTGALYVTALEIVT